MKKFIIILLISHFLLFTAQLVSAQQAGEPAVTENVWFCQSIPVREMTVVLPGKHQAEKPKDLNLLGKLPENIEFSVSPTKKPVLQKTQECRQFSAPVQNFAGVSNVNDFFTADPNGDVGLNHYVQTVNNSFAVWDKNGNLLYGPADNKTIWSSFPGPWNTCYWSDPVFKYDQMADRWIISSIAITNNMVDYYTMIAVSATPDPLGSYYCYAYHFDALNDYPKLSVWWDGYYMSHRFFSAQNLEFIGNHYSVVEREAMLNGDPTAAMIQFLATDTAELFLFPLPADLRGTGMPGDAPCYFVKPACHDPGNPWHLFLDIHAFSTDWNVPANTSFEQIAQFDLGEFVPVPYPYGAGAPQMGSDIDIFAITQMMMYPLTYRMFSDHEAMVCCQTMWDGEIHYIKWYELRKDSSAWYLYQSGNFASGDLHRLFPSISLNGNGDMALGYTVTGEDMYPSIRYTGRRAEDSAGIMTFPEMDLYNGLNYANTFLSGFEMNRWGDYSSMMTDPSDDSTFWYTNMYSLSNTSYGNWATRIFTLNFSGDTLLPYAFAGNDTVAPNVVFFETQGEAENYNSLVWTSSGDGQFATNNDEHSLYLRGPGDLDNGQVTLTMHLTGYYPGTQAADSMVLYLKDTITSIYDTHPAELSLNIYPNPTRDIITVEADLPSDNQLILSVISESGKQLFTGKYKPDNRHFEQQFDLRYLPAGVYLIRLQAGEEAETEKIMKID